MLSTILVRRARMESSTLNKVISSYLGSKRLLLSIVRIVGERICIEAREAAIFITIYHGAGIDGGGANPSDYCIFPSKRQ
jgi:hypothetical protein